MVLLDHCSLSVLTDMDRGRHSSDYSPAMLAWEAHNAGRRDAVPEYADIAFTIHASERQRQVFEALLFGDCPDDVLVKALEVPQESIDCYRELFFDTHVFRTRLDRIEYLDTLTGEEQELKRKSYDIGYFMILNMFAGMRLTKEERHALDAQQYATSAAKSLVMRYAPVTSEVTKQALRHTGAMIDLGEKLDKADREQANNVEFLNAIFTPRDPSDVDPPDRPVTSEDII